MRRPERVADLLREEISQIVGYELEDPRISVATVTDVRISDDLRDATVYVMIDGTEAEAKAAMAALLHAAPYVRKELGITLDLRHAPELHFVRDTVEEQGARVDRLLAEIKRTSHPEISPDTSVQENEGKEKAAG
jgi:ribosome-binding factor A